MIKYAKIINENTGLCEIGIGTNIDFYKSIGMCELDVQQSDIDSNWYLSEKCPMKSEEEKLQQAKQAKYTEANTGARAYLESGEALFELEADKHIEATDGNIGKLSAYALSFITGTLQSEDVIYWNTKEDETIALTQEQLSTVLQGIGQVQAEVWNIKFPAYLARLEAAQTVEDVDAIVIDYSLPVVVEDVPHNDGESQNEPC